MFDFISKRRDSSFISMFKNEIILNVMGVESRDQRELTKFKLFLPIGLFLSINTRICD